MDLASLDLTKAADVAAPMTVLHPVTDEPLLDDNGQPVVIMLLGAESTVIAQETRRRAQQQLSKRNPKMSYDEAQKVSAELIAACTVSWSSMTEDGVRLECTRENAVHVYTKYAWLRQQADRFINDRANFFNA